MANKATGQVIERGQAYTLDEFKARAGWSQHAYRTAKRQGLKVVPTAGRVYITGDSFLDYLASIAAKQEQSQN